MFLLSVGNISSSLPFKPHVYLISALSILAVWVEIGIEMQINPFFPSFSVTSNDVITNWRVTEYRNDHNCVYYKK